MFSQSYDGKVITEGFRMSQQLKTYLGITFASIFSVWSSYSIHVLPIETQALPILEALLDGTGRAPDQYRIAPYFLITLIRDGISLFVGADLQLRYSILVFDGFFLFLSALALIRHFNCVNDIQTGWLFLIYPFLMFGGYRPTASFILFLSVHAVVLIRKTSAHQSGAWPLLLITLLLSVTRADIALLFAICSFGVAGLGRPTQTALIAIPLIAQLLLSNLMFTEAEYYSQIFMLRDNLTLRYLGSSPITFAWVALLIRYWQPFKSFVSYGARESKSSVFAMIAYTITLCLIARPDEYRLFLPFLPLILWLYEGYREEVESI